LKRQTAIRLAQEQRQQPQQKRLVSSHNGKSSHSSRLQSSPAPSVSSLFSKETGTEEASFSSSYNEIRSIPLSGTVSSQSLPLVVRVLDSPESRSLTSGTRQAPRDNVSHHTPDPVIYFDVSTQPSASLETGSADSTPMFVQSTLRGQVNNAKPKLPQGLTVYELKEMTRARLQAEAAEKRNQCVHEGDLYASSHHLPVSSFSAPGHAAPPRLINHPPNYQGQHCIPPGSLHGYHDCFGIDLALPSHLNPTMYGVVRPMGLVDTWSRGTRSDYWETASGSKAVSDYSLPSQVYPTSNETPSFPFPQNHGLGDEAPVIDCGLSRFSDASPQPGNNSDLLNRPRARTASPQVGLSRLYENHQILDNTTLSGFSCETRSEIQREPFLTLGKAGYFAPGNHRTHQEVVGDSVIGLGDGIRPRAWTETAVPSLCVGGNTITNDNIESKQAGVTGLVDAFWAHSGGSLKSPSFDLTNLSQPTIDGFVGDPRHRAATWAGNSAFNNPFGPSLLDSSNVTETPRDELAEGLASILKLSGVEEKTCSLSPVSFQIQSRF
jgi:hypothetical protein